MSKRKLLLANNPLLSGPNLDERARPLTGLAPSKPSPFKEVLIEEISQDPNQPRRFFDPEKLQELSASILEYGVLSPLLVKRSPDSGYILIAGERRLRASKLAGLDKVPVIIENDSKSEVDIRAIQLIENLQREDLNPVERAEAISTLRDNFDLSVREIAKRLGISKSVVQRSLDVLQLPEDLLHALANGASESKILLLAKVEDLDLRSALLENLDVISRTELEKEIQKKQKSLKTPNKNLISDLVQTSDDLRIADEIRGVLGVKVVIHRTSGSNGGRLQIDFYSRDDLDELFRRLTD